VNEYKLAADYMKEMGWRQAPPSLGLPSEWYKWNLSGKMLARHGDVVWNSDVVHCLELARFNVAPE
jgi:hypothetical protein